MKSEPGVYSIDDLARDGQTFWDSVRNYQARNFMMNEMRVGDLVFFYHSNAEPSGIAGLAKVLELAQPDPTQFDRKSEYYDAKATQQNPRWYGVTLKFVKRFSHTVSLEMLRSQPALSEMLVLKRGQRLSVQPVTLNEYEGVLKLVG